MYCSKYILQLYCKHAMSKYFLFPISWIWYFIYCTCFLLYWWYIYCILYILYIQVLCTYIQYILYLTVPGYLENKCLCIFVRLFYKKWICSKSFKKLYEPHHLHFIYITGCIYRIYFPGTILPCANLSLNCAPYQEMFFARSTSRSLVFRRDASRAVFGQVLLFIG